MKILRSFSMLLAFATSLLSAKGITLTKADLTRDFVSLIENKT